MEKTYRQSPRAVLSSIGKSIFSSSRRAGCSAVRPPPHRQNGCQALPMTWHHAAGTTLGTFYHFKLFLMLKQHAYNAGLRQNGLDFWQHPLVFLTLDHFFAKSRSVIAVHLHDPLLEFRSHLTDAYTERFPPLECPPTLIFFQSSFTI